MNDSVDQLNFKVLLDTTEFDKSIKEVQKKAEDFNSTVTRILEAKKSIDQITASQKAVAESTREAASVSKDWEAAQRRIAENLEKEKSTQEQIADNEKMRLSSAEKLLDSQKRIKEATKDTKDEELEHAKALLSSRGQLSSIESAMRTIAQLTGVVFGVAGVRRFVDSLVSVTGEFEVQKMALTSMLQSEERADEIFNTLQKRALESPYTFQDLTKYAKQLTAFNIDADSLIETESRLADVAAGLGVDIGRIILAYGQVKAAGVLKGTELRQFTEAGVPLLQSLAEQIMETEGHAISLAEVFQRITRKEIPFEMVEEAFKRMTSEGGKFYKMQEVLVETLKGKIGKLRDVWQQSLYRIGESQSTVLKGAVDLLTSLAANIENVGRVLAPVIAAFGAYYAALLLFKSIGIVVLLVKQAQAFVALAKAEGLAATATVAFGSALKGLAAGLGILALVAVAAVEVHQAVKKNREESEKYATAVAECTRSINEEKDALDKLMKVARDENRSLADRQSAIDQINSQYSEYIRNMGIEKVSVDNLKTSYDNLTAAIANKYLEELKEQTVGARRTELNDAENELVKFTTGLVKGAKGISDFKVGGVVGKVMKTIQDRNRAIRPEGLYNLISKIYADAGISISGEENKMLGLIESLVESSDNLKRAEKGFEQFSAGYQKSMGIVKATTENVTGDDGKPVWGSMAKSGTTESVVDEWEQLREMSEEVDDILQDLFDANLDQLDADNKKLDKELDEREKAIAQYNRFIGESLAKGNKSGSGINLKLSGYLVDWNSADTKALVEYTKAVGNLNKQYEVGSESYEKAKDKLWEIYQIAKQANKDEFYEKVRGLSDEIIKAGLAGYELSNWNDKSISQLKEIRETLRSIEVPESIKTQLKGLDDLIALLIGDVEDGKEELENNTLDPEEIKKIAKAVKSVASSIKSVISNLKEYADLSGNAGLSAVLDDTLSITEGISSVAQGFSSGGPIGAIAAGFAWVANKVLEARIETEKLKQTLVGVREEARAASMADALSAGVDTIFGTNDLKSVENATELIKTLSTAMSKYAKDIGSMQFNTTKRGFFRSHLSSPYNTDDLAALAQAVNGELYDAYGNLNADTLQVILDTYENLDAAQKEWLQTAINDSEAYAAAMEQVEGVMESVFGNVADDAADAMIDRWIEAGDAALDYADILDDVAKSYAKMVLKSAILDTVLNDDAIKAVSDAFVSGDYGKAMSLVEGDLAEIAAMEPIFNQILSTFDPYFNRDSESASDSSSSLGSGIKSITEDTANLLASYINAIRADVSSIKTMMENGNSITGEAGAPSLNDYLAQCAANTYKIATSNQAILEEMRSVIGVPGSSGMVVRTEVY